MQTWHKPYNNVSRMTFPMILCNMNWQCNILQTLAAMWWTEGVFLQLLFGCWWVLLSRGFSCSHGPHAKGPTNDVSFLGHPKWNVESSLSFGWQCGLLICYRLWSQNSNLPLASTACGKMALFGSRAVSRAAGGEFFLSEMVTNLG